MVVEPNLSKIQVEEIESKKVLSENLFFKIAANLNSLQQKIIFDVGDVVDSVLTESQFQAELSSDWVLCNGQNIENSLLSTLTGLAFAPDMRGRFLKQSLNGDDTLFIEANNNAPHRHAQIRSNSSGGSTGNLSQRVFRNTGIVVVTSPAYFISGSTGEPDAGQTRDSGSNLPNNGSEFRPKNIALYRYIKIN